MLAPLSDYARTPLLKTNVLLADLFLMMLTYTLLNALLESFFFRRVDPVWIVFVLAALGLRLVAPRGSGEGFCRARALTHSIA